MSKLEEEAAAFKRKKEQSAARVARHRERQRTGTKTYPVQLDRIVAGQLIRAREIPPGASDADIGAEIANVVAAALRGRLRVTPPLPPETRVDLQADTNRPKAKGKQRRKRDPGRILTGAEKARLAAQIMAEEERRRAEEEADLRVEANWAKYKEQYDPVTQSRLRKERIARERREKEEALRAKIAANPPPAPKARVFQPLGGSGISKKGGKPITNGFGAAPRGKSQADAVKPIKTKPKAADVKKFAEITPPDDSIHTVRATDAEIENLEAGEADFGSWDDED